MIFYKPISQLHWLRFSLPHEMISFVENLVLDCQRTPTPSTPSTTLLLPAASNLYGVLSAADDHVLLPFSLEALPQNLAAAVFGPLHSLHCRHLLHPLHLDVAPVDNLEFGVVEKVLALGAKTIEDDLFGDVEDVLKIIESFILNRCISELYFGEYLSHQKIGVHQNCSIAAIFFELLVPEVQQHRINLFDHELCDDVPDFICLGSHSIAVCPFQGLVATIFQAFSQELK